MVQKKQAFTLIELLVVVLIIGILAAVALPQYQKAVTKAQVTQELTVFNAYKKGINVWLLANDWPTTGKIYFTGNATGECANYPLASLDIAFSSLKTQCSDIVGDIYASSFISTTAASVSTLYYADGKYKDGTKACHSQFQLQKGASAWNLAAILYKGQNSAHLATQEQCPEYQKMMCQYWATQGTGLGRSPAITQCARWGVTLELSE